MTPLEEARAFQAEATKGGNRQKGRPSARGRGGRGRDRGDSPHTPSARGRRGGGGRGGSLLQRATSHTAHQPAPFEQEQSGCHLPSTPSYTPQNVKPRPFAIPIVAPPSANSGFTPSASPSGIGSSMFAPQAAPKSTALVSGSSKSQAPTTRGSSSIEESRHSAGAMTPQRQPTLHRGRGRGGGLRMSRFASQKENDAVFAFFNDDTPVPVGEVRYYQEEYEEKKKTSEQQRTEVPSAATSRSQGEPIATGDNTSHEANPNTELATSTKSSSTASTAKPVASLAPTPVKIPAHPTSSKSGPKNRESLHVNDDNNKTDHNVNPKKEVNVKIKAEAEKARAKGEAEITPHDKYSSSVGVLGCKIDINRKALAKQKEDAKPKEEAKAEIKPAPVDSKTADDQELERAALLREIEEQEAALAEMKKLIAIKRANAGLSLQGPNQDNAATGFIASPKANLGGAQSSVPALTESSQIMVSQSGFNSQASVSHNTGDTMPNPASNSMDDSMDLDFEPATMQYVPHPSPLDLSNGHSSFQNGFQEAEEEEEL